jgi:hypothetical protein
MNYENFVLELMKQLQDRMGSELTVERQSVVKVNLGTLDSLVILEKKGSENGTSPNFYLQPMYERFQKGVEMEVFAEEVEKIYHLKRQTVETEINAKKINDYQTVKDRIFFRIINTEKNRELLEQSPHYSFLDLSFAYFLLLTKETDDGVGSVRVSSHFLDLWGISQEELHRQAVENTRRLFPSRIGSLRLEYNRLFHNGADCPTEQENIQTGGQEKEILILSNRQGINGFSAVMYPDYLKKLSEKLKQNLYILPSSLHEAMVVPEDRVKDSKDKKAYEQLREVVAMVNATSVKEEDYLSGEVYYYDGEQDMLGIAGGNQTEKIS